MLKYFKFVNPLEDTRYLFFVVQSYYFNIDYSAIKYI